MWGIAEIIDANVLRYLRIVFATVFALTIHLDSLAATYKCEVTEATYAKADGTLGHVTRDVLHNRQQHAIIEDERSPAVRRCSFALSAGRVTCDRYAVDLVEVDRNVNIKKFYVLRSQFDIQLFGDLSFIENNGRGGLGYGTCSLVSP